MDSPVAGVLGLIVASSLLFDIFLGYPSVAFDIRNNLRNTTQQSNGRSVSLSIFNGDDNGSSNNQISQIKLNAVCSPFLLNRNRINSDDNADKKHSHY